MTGEPVALATRFAFGYLVNSQGFIKEAMSCAVVISKRGLLFSYET